jgi:hypothetical protein
MEGLHRREMMEPAAQRKADPRRISTISGAIGPDSSGPVGSMNNATPARPGTKAAKVKIFGRSSAEITNLMSTIQNGIVASITAANPEGTYFSAYASVPWQPPNRRTPPAAADAFQPFTERIGFAKEHAACG